MIGAGFTIAGQAASSAARIGRGDVLRAENAAQIGPGMAFGEEGLEEHTDIQVVFA